MRIARDYDCNAWMFISYARNWYSINILRILECEGSIRGDLTCASKMLENDSYVLILFTYWRYEWRIQSYTSLELIQSILFVFIILCIYFITLFPLHITYWSVTVRRLCLRLQKRWWWWCSLNCSRWMGGGKRITRWSLGSRSCYC